MTRVKTGTTRHARHKKVLKTTKGYRMTKNRLFKVAHEAMLHAGEYAFMGRKKRKRDLRSLWITRINAGLRTLDPQYTYRMFIADLHRSKLQLDRKIVAELAVSDPSAFEAVVKKVRSAK